MQSLFYRLRKPLILHIKFEDDHITILDDIFFTLELHLSQLSSLRSTPCSQEIVTMDYLCFDKSFLEVGMDRCGSSRCRTPDEYCPSSGFFLTRREVIHQPYLTKCRSDQIIKCRDMRRLRDAQ